jgi:hypothetical protein
MNKQNSPNLLTVVFKILCIAIVVITISAAIWAFFQPNEKQSPTLIISLLCIAIVTIILVSSFDKISEISGPGGLKLKMFDKLENIQKQTSYNKSFLYQDHTSTNNYFWVDEYGISHNIPDHETALFLSKGGGITSLQKLDFTLGPSYPSLKTAVAKSPNNVDVFIIYNNKLYYQQGLGWLYWLAAYHSVDIDNKEFRNWAIDGKNFVQKLTVQEITAVGIG